MLTKEQEVFLEKEEESLQTGAVLVVIAVLVVMAIIGVLAHTYATTAEKKEVYSKNKETGQCFVQRRHRLSSNYSYWAECPCPEIQEQ
jgi:hypothetical protein